MQIRRTLWGALVATSLIVSGCGDDGDSSPAPGEPGAASTDDASVPSSTTGQPSTTAVETTTTAPAPPRTAAPELIATTDLLAEGVIPLPEVGLPPPIPPGRYHSYRLGTEIAFDVPVDAVLGQHFAGSIAFDDGPDRILFVSRYGDDEPRTADGWIDELLSSDADVEETDWPDISGNPVRHFDVTSSQERIAGVQAQGALSFEPGTPHGIWFIEQGDVQPIVIGTRLTGDDWSQLVDDIVASIELGPTEDDPRNGRARIEYGGDPFWRADAGSSYRTLLFGSTVLTAPTDLSGLAGGQYLEASPPGDYEGVTPPLAAIAAIDGYANAAELTTHLSGLSEQGVISPLRTPNAARSILGAAAATVEFDVPNGGEVFLFLAEPDGWSHLKVFTLRPASTYRISVADVDEHVAVAVASADEGFAGDLEAATALLNELLDALG